MEYQSAILAIALLVNLIGSAVLLLLIRRHMREPAKTGLRPVRA
jgi:hypothetical protein